MCSIYDNLRKGLGNVSKDRCIFIFLTLLSIFAGSYCCNISALPGFEWFIHHSEFLKNISYSVVAGYIFYLVQYVISNYILGKKALKLLICKRPILQEFLIEINSQKSFQTFFLMKPV